jgi:hypothetical protein
MIAKPQCIIALSITENVCYSGGYDDAALLRGFLQAR